MIVRDHVRVASLGGSWEQAAAGDGAVFALFYQRHADRVFAHCFSRIGSRTTAEDLTAQVFEITWRRRAAVRVDENADILPWLLATANNLLAEHHRAAARTRRLLVGLSPLGDEPDHAVELADRDEFDHDLALAVTVLAALDHVDREVIELCVMHGLSPTAAAQAAGISASTMRTRLSRALARARHRYRSAAAHADRARAEVHE